MFLLKLSAQLAAHATHDRAFCVATNTRMITNKTTISPSAISTKLIPATPSLINVQGDEPLIDPGLIDQLASVFETDPDLCMATVKTEMFDEAEQTNPNNVKVVTDRHG